MADRLPLEWLARGLPSSWAVALGAAAGDLAWLLDHTHRRRVEERMARFLPSLSRARRHRLARAAARKRGALRFLAHRLLALRDVAFCRHLDLTGWDNLHAPPDTAEEGIAATAPLGAPAVAARTLALYRPGTRLLSLPAAAGSELLAGDDLLRALGGARRVRLTAVLALAAGDRFRIEVLSPVGLDPAAPGAAIALGHWVEGVEGVVRRHPAQFDWGARR